MSKVFYFVRHGQTDWNKARKLQGHSNIPLNEIGKDQAQRIKEKINLNNIGRVVTSDLIRAQETARIITDSLHLPFYSTENLREVHLGEAEGLSVEEIIKRDPLLWEKWSSNKYLRLQFKHGESKIAMLSRVFSEIEQQVLNEEKEVLFVSHGLVIRNLVHFFRSDLTDTFFIPNCACIPFRYLSTKNYEPLLDRMQTIEEPDPTFHQARK